MILAVSSLVYDPLARSHASQGLTRIQTHADFLGCRVALRPVLRERSNNLSPLAFTLRDHHRISPSSYILRFLLQFFTNSRVSAPFNAVSRVLLGRILCPIELVGVLF